MARFKEEIDFYFTESGDFWLSKNGDIEDTKLDAYRGFLQRVDTRMRSAKGDWATQVNLGAGITDYLGKRNTEGTANSLRQRIYSELYQDDLLRAAELVVEILPISEHELAIALIITPPRTVQQITLLYTYSLVENKIFLRSI